MKPNPQSIRWLRTEIPAWVSEGLLTDTAAEKLINRYGEPPPAKRLALIIFGIIGSLLIASGIILLFAYNWENFGRPLRAVLALAPLLVCQALGAWVLLRKSDSLAWKEGVATGTVLSLAAAIGLIGQTYHVEGNWGSFLLTWALLSLPVMVVYQSGMAFALYQAIILGWAGYAHGNGATPQLYWLLLLPSLYLLWEFYRGNRGGTLRALQWCLVITLSAALGLALEYSMPGFWLILYSGWFSFLFMVQSADKGGWREHPFGFIGGLGIAVLTIILTFSYGWHDLIGSSTSIWQPSSWKDWLDILVGMVVMGAAGITWSQHYREKHWAALLWGSAFLVFTAGYMITVMLGEDLATLLANAYLFILAVTTIRHGLHHGAQSTVNKGLVLLSALVLMRFFDRDMGTLGRGLAFIGVGAGFLIVNLRLARRFKKEAP